MKPGLFKIIPITKIIVPQGQEAQAVSELVESIHQFGVLNPITVTPKFKIIAGRKRLAAAKVAGLKAVPVHIISLSNIQNRIVEIDENLVRIELTYLARGELLMEKKELLLSQGEITKRGGDRKSKKIKAQNLRADPTKSFSEKMAKDMKLSKRVIEEEVNLAKKLEPSVRDEIRGTPTADSKTELRILSQQDKKTQMKAAQLIGHGKAKTVREALAAIAPTEEEIEIPEFSRKIKALSRFGKQLDEMKDIAKYLLDNAPKKRHHVEEQGRKLVTHVADLTKKARILKVRLANLGETLIAVSESESKSKGKSNSTTTKGSKK